MRRLLTLLLLATAKPVYGGQAVVEGVMMKGKDNYTVSVNTSKGLKTTVFPFKSITEKYKILKLPFIRGMVNLVEMLIIGYKSLFHSADMALEEEQVEGNTTWILIGTLLFSIALAIFLFKFLPLGAATLLDKLIGLSSVMFNIVDGVIKMAIFVAYIAIIGLYPDVKEIFRYHGGEHKAVSCFERGKKLTLKNIAASSQVHLRCGTTFLFVVIFFSILVYLFIPSTLPFVYNLALRLALLPIIAGISYEFQRLGAKYPRNFSIFLRPGLWLQALTVNTPLRKHMRPAKASLEKLIAIENND